jgi:hypothetical protein
MLGDSNLHKKGKGILSDMQAGDNVHVLVLRKSKMRRIFFFYIKKCKTTVTSEHQDIVACKFDTCNRRKEQSVKRQILNFDYPSIVKTVSDFFRCVFIFKTRDACYRYML